MFDKAKVEEAIAKGRVSDISGHSYNVICFGISFT